MIKKILKWTGIVLGLLVALLMIAYGVILFRINERMHRKYAVQPEQIKIDYDSASLASGERLVATRACRECHGEDLGGRVLVDDFLLGRFVVKNITHGKGGLPANFGVDDWVLAIKHGLKRDGSPLFVMPSHELSHLSENDLADVIAYCSQLPPVDREMPAFELGPLAYVLTEFDQIPLLPAELTDHNKPLVQAVVPEVSAAYGKYLAIMCVNCHGNNYKGGKSPVPGGKDRPDITSAGNPAKWTEEQFLHALRTGETPEGKKMNPDEMPWMITKNYSDLELKALRLYLLSL